MGGTPAGELVDLVLIWRDNPRCGFGNDPGPIHFVGRASVYVWTYGHMDRLRDRPVGVNS